MPELQKRKPYRNPKMLEACREENGQCLVNIPGCKGWGPTAAAHSNRAEDGKGGRQKADDCFVAKACQYCHDVLDGRRKIVDNSNRYSSQLIDIDWYHDRGIKRTIRYFIDKGVKF